MARKWEVVVHRISGDYVGTRRIEAETANAAIEAVRARTRNPGELMIEAELIDDYDEFDQDD